MRVASAKLVWPISQKGHTKVSSWDISFQVGPAAVVGMSIGPQTVLFTFDTLKKKEKNTSQAYKFNSLTWYHINEAVKSFNLNWNFINFTVLYLS